MSEQNAIERTSRYFGEYVSLRDDLGDIALRTLVISPDERHVQYIDAFHVNPDGGIDARPLTKYEVDTIQAMHESWQAAPHDER